MVRKEPRWLRPIYERAQYSMSDNNDKMEFTIGIQLTEKCILSCAHCGTYSSPQSTATCSKKNLQKWIEEIADIAPASHIGFTGGEPLQAEELLRHGIETVNGCGLKYGVITNGYWAKSKKKRKRILDSLKDCKNLSISTDRFHQEIITTNVIVALFHDALELGINVLLHFTLLRNDNKEEILQLYRYRLDKIGKDVINFSAKVSDSFFHGKEEIEYELLLEVMKIELISFAESLFDGEELDCLLDVLAYESWKVEAARNDKHRPFHSHRRFLGDDVYKTVPIKEKETFLYSMDSCASQIKCLKLPPEIGQYYAA